MNGMRIRCTKKLIRPSDLDGSNHLVGTNLGLEIERVADELLLLAKSLEDRVASDDGWPPFAQEDLARYASRGDESDIFPIIDKMVSRGFLRRVEEGLLKVEAKLVEIFYGNAATRMHIREDRMSAYA